MSAQEPSVPGAAAATSIFDHEHTIWNGLLKDFVHAGGFVDYQGLALRRGELDAYLHGLEIVTPAAFAKWTDSQRQALWINAYNAYAVRLILDHYPVDSIKDLGGMFSSVFSKEIIPLQRLAGVDARSQANGSDKLTLGEVEHDILARVSQQPLFHFAIVCASWSCPELLNEAYTATKLNKQLKQQARHFLADSRKNNQQIQGGKLHVSKIFAWAEDELETYPGGIHGLFKEFGPASVVQAVDFGKVKWQYRDYDWSLNEWKAPTTK